MESALDQPEARPPSLRNGSWFGHLVSWWERERVPGAGPSESLCPHPSTLVSGMFSLHSPVSPTPLIRSPQPPVLTCSVSSRPVFISRCICACERSQNACSRSQRLVITTVSILSSFWTLILCLCGYANTFVSTNNMQLAVGYTSTQTELLTSKTFKFNLRKQSRNTKSFDPEKW